MTLALKKRQLLLVALVVLLAIPLTLLLYRTSAGIVRDVILVPLLYLAWIVQLYVRAVPQVLFWGGLVLLGLALALTSVLVGRGDLIGRGRRAKEGEVFDRGRAGQVQRLTSQIRFAARSTYFRRHLAQRLGRVMLRHLDYGKEYSPAQVERALDALDAPPEIRAFLREGKQLLSLSRSSGLIAWLKRRFWAREETVAGDLNLEQIVRFLEDRLEVS